jgi:hypothetical protein
MSRVRRGKLAALAAGGLAALLLAAPAHAAFPLAQPGKIAFSSSEPSQTDTWTMNADGSGQAT